MTEMMGKVDTFHVEEIVGEFEVPCDYAEDPNGSCKNARAEWVLHLVKCECGRGGKSLACNHCMEVRMASDSAVECECGAVTAPARHAYNYFEYIDRSFG